MTLLSAVVPLDANRIAPLRARYKFSVVVAADQFVKSACVSESRTGILHQHDFRWRQWARRWSSLRALALLTASDRSAKSHGWIVGWLTRRQAGQGVPYLSQPTLKES